MSGYTCDVEGCSGVHLTREVLCTPDAAVVRRNRTREDVRLERQLGVAGVVVGVVLFLLALHVIFLGGDLGKQLGFLYWS